MNGSLWKIDENGNRIGQYVSWPRLTLPKADLWLSFQDTMYNSLYYRPGFTMSLGTAKAEVKQTANAGTYSISIQGDTVADVYNLKTLVYHKLGFEEVSVFPPIVLQVTSFLGRLWWLVSGRLPEKHQAKVLQQPTRSQVQGKGPLPYAVVLTDDNQFRLASSDEPSQTWVRLDQLSNYLSTDPETLWDRYFQTWVSEGNSSLVIIALRIETGVFVDGITQEGKRFSGEFLLGSEQAFLNALREVYITAEKAFQLLKQ